MLYALSCRGPGDTSMTSAPTPSDSRGESMMVARFVKAGSSAGPICTPCNQAGIVTALVAGCWRADLSDMQSLARHAS